MCEKTRKDKLSNYIRRKFGATITEDKVIKNRLK